LSSLKLAFFPRKRKKHLRFISLKRRGESFVVTILLRGRSLNGKQKGTAQCTSQFCGSRTRRPDALALAQRAASSRIFVTTLWMDGSAPFNTQSLRCFQISHGARPLRSGLGVACLALFHQLRRVSSCSEGLQVARSQERCQT
jgi:hypothetical protein